LSFLLFPFAQMTSSHILPRGIFLYIPAHPSNLLKVKGEESMNFRQIFAPCVGGGWVACSYPEDDLPKQFFRID
jgi:hypothetical protein